EARRLIRLAERVSRPFGLLVRLAAVLGARRGELCGLRWEDIDLPALTLTIRTGIADVARRLVETDPKSHKPRTLSIDAATRRRPTGPWPTVDDPEHLLGLRPRTRAGRRRPPGRAPRRTLMSTSHVIRSPCEVAPPPHLRHP